ncbi:MAG: chemotaxis protein CheW [Firmicutes bacterium]|nr:chemotaxis protein CheW [Bacillota bacterium]
MSNDYLSMFIDETREHLQAWSDGLMAMERSGDATAVPVLFRAAHTIKGMSMTMGFTRMGEITHAAESLLDGIRTGSLDFSRPLVDILLQALDVLESLLQSVEATGEEAALDTAAIQKALRAAASASPVATIAATGSSHESTVLPARPGESDVATAPTPVDEQEVVIKKVALQAIALGYNVYEIVIGFADDCLMPLARFAQWLQQVDLNLLLHTVPDATTLERGDYKGDIKVVLASTQEFDTVGRTLSDISEVVIREISEWTAESPDASPKRHELLPQNRHITDDEHVRSVILHALAQDIQVYEVGILLAPTCQMKAARCMLLFDAVGGQNRLLFTQPHIAQIEEEKMDRHILFVMWSKDSLDVVQRAIESVSEIELVELRQWHQEGAEPVRGDNSIAGPMAAQAVTVAERKKVSTIRVDTEKLDDLMNLVSELAIDKTRLERIRGEVTHVGLNETVDHMSRLSSQLQELIMSIRMVPVETVFHRFPRMVRDTARQLDKDIDFVVAGEDTELDRTVVEEIGDPIMHMLRNSLDHGVETPLERIAQGKPKQGRIELRAYAAGNHVFIEVEDDGRGINRDKVYRRAVERGLIGSADQLTDHQVHQLLFASGFSTADQVSDLSGRGVGLDVVKAKIEALSGKVDIYSEEGKGSRFVIRLPMTLAIMDGLLVRIGANPYLMPISSIAETGRLEAAQTVHGSEVVIWRGQVVPLVRAHSIFRETGDASASFIVYVSRGDKVVGIVVDELIGQYEVVQRNLHAELKKIPYFAGATILGDGEVALIIDANAFIE